ncbi:MAG TPA: magnesium/cobalt transporter CorA [Thermoanaerobaculia bacterium]|nr:magnesium/cobalt transporter CorA [Thermoanaerobaculia bacterium]
MIQLPRLPRLTHRRAAPGTAPGTLHPREQRVQQIELRLMCFGRETLEERNLGSVDELPAVAELVRPGFPGAVWLDVVGLHDVELLAAVGRCFGLHPLALEDVANLGQRPKVEPYGEHLFIVLDHLHAGDQAFAVEQISLFLLPGLVITFQEVPGDPFAPVRERIRRGGNRLRTLGADYLAYALIDSVVDHFFPVLESFGERIETLEEELVDRPEPAVLEHIYRLRRELLMMRRIAWPERDVLSTLYRDELPLIGPETQVFLRDCHDHAVRALEILETYRELAGSMLDVYLSSLSHRMNEVMKVLTIIATIFIPLTFIAGVYGMNFARMPELHWRWGYPASLGMMAVVAAALVYYFRRKGWF